MNQPTKELMGPGRRITRNTILLVGLRLLRPLLSMVLVVAVSRLLGASEFGRYTLALALLLIFNEIAPLGLSAWIAREGARTEATLAVALANAMTLVTVIGAALVAVMVGIGFALGYDAATTEAILVLSPAIVPAALANLFEGAFIARERMDCIAASSLSESVFKVVGALAALGAGYGLLGVVAVIVLSHVVAAGVSALLLRRLGVRVRFGWGVDARRELVRVAPTFLLITVFATLFWRVGIFFLGHLRPIEEVGEYGAAWRLLELALIFPQSLCLALYPSMAAARDDRATLEHLGAAASRYLAAGAIPLAVVFTMLARPVLVLLYGEELAPAADTLAILIWTVVPYAWVRFNAYVLLAAERQRVDLGFNAAMTVLNLVLNVALVPSYGAKGTAISLLVTMSVHFVIQNVYLSRHLAGRAAPLRWDPAVVLAAVVLASCVYLLRAADVWWALGVGGAAYAATLRAGGFFQRAGVSLTELEQLYRPGKEANRDSARTSPSSASARCYT